MTIGLPFNQPLSTGNRRPRPVGRVPDSLRSTPNAVAGIKAYFEWSLEQIEDRQARGEQLFNYEFAHAYGQLQDRDATLAQLRGYVEARAYPAQWMARDVWFRFLHGDPEFEGMLRELGMPSQSERSRP